MQRSLLLGIAIVIALAVAGYLYFTQLATVPTGSRPNDSAQTTPSETGPAMGGAAGSATEDAADTTQRTLVAQPEGGTRMTVPEAL